MGKHSDFGKPEFESQLVVLSIPTHPHSTLFSIHSLTVVIQQKGQK